MAVTTQEKQVLQELARRMAEIAQDPIYEQKRRLWAEKNALIKNRPLVLSAIPDTAWRELIPDSRLVVEDPLFRYYERILRQKIYKREHIRDDDVLTDKLYVPLQYTVTDWLPGRQRPYTEEADHAAAYDPCVLEYSDIKKLQKPRIVDVDFDRANHLYEEAQDIFGGHLQVELGLPYCTEMDGVATGIGNGLVDLLCELRGLENIFYDMRRAPDFVHELMELITQGTLEYLDQMEQHGLLRLNNNEFFPSANTVLNSNGLGCCDELPGESFDPAHVKTQNLWGYVQAQEFTVVSGKMLQEFVLPYHARVAERFGLVCYGCCEKQDKKWDMEMEMIPNLRELSVPFSCDLEIAADKIRDKYVFSWKPTATMVTMFEKERVQAELRQGFEAARDCHLALSMRDGQTFNGHPEYITQWTDMAMEMAMEYA